jgi:hypothetical protein
VSVNPRAAKFTLIGKFPGKEDMDVVVEIGIPYQARDDPSEWACPISVSPLYASLPDQHGVDEFQSLFLAMRLALSLLKGFTDDGGSLLVIDEKFPGQNFSFDAYRWEID